jgi:hypothetical protein
VARKSWTLAGLAALLVAAGSGASSATAQLWSAPATLGHDGLAVSGDVDVDADGTAIVAWVAEDGPVRVAVRLPGAAFGTTLTLAPDDGRRAAVALDGGGGALVAWSSGGNLGLAERTAAVPALTGVATGITDVASGPDVAFTGPGEAIVVWTGEDGAVHGLSRNLGAATMPLADIAPGPGNRSPHVDATGGHAVVAWTHSATEGTQTTAHVRASVRGPGGSFGAAEDLATATATTVSPASGSNLATHRVVVSAGGAADVLFSQLYFQSLPADFEFRYAVAPRSMGAWAPAQRYDVAAGPLPLDGRFSADVAAGAAGDALYAQSFRSGSSTTFSARLRSPGAATYGDAFPLHTGEVGEVQTAPLTAGRYLVLIRSGSGLRTREGSPATGFGDPLVFSSTNGSRLIGLAGAQSGGAVAAWATTAGTVHVAMYGDSLGAVPDTTDPRLTRLSASPRRFVVRRRSRTAARIRWRLSEPARVTLRIERARTRRCVARRCKRFTPVGSFARTRQAGKAVVPFNGYIQRRALRPGRYRLTAVPRDAAGNRGAANRRAFVVLRRD